MNQSSPHIRSRLTTFSIAILACALPTAPSAQDAIGETPLDGRDSIVSAMSPLPRSKLQKHPREFVIERQFTDTEERLQADVEADRVIPLDGYGAIRRRMIRIDIDALSADNRRDQLVGRKDLSEWCASPETDWCQGFSTRFSLFPGLAFDARNTLIKQSTDGDVWSWEGTFNHFGQEGTVLLSIESKTEKAVGIIFLGDEIYRIEPTFAPPLHVVYQVDRAAGYQTDAGSDVVITSESKILSPRDFVEKTSTPGLQHHAHSGQDSLCSLSGSGTFAESIGVLVVYPSQVRTRHSSITAHINSLIDLANKTLTNSGIGSLTVNYHLVHHQEVSYSKTNIETDRNRLRGKTDGTLDNVHAIRNSYSADLVVLLGEYSGGLQGTAFQLTPPLTVQQESLGFAVVDDASSMDRLVFPHELAHLLGAGHEPQDGEPSACDYSHAWNNTRDSSLVATFAACGGQCVRKPWLSNPAQSRGSTTTENNTRTIKVTAPFVRRYREPTTTAPGVPPSHFVHQCRCYGGNIANWGNSSGQVTKYQLYRSSTTNSAAKTMLYEGTSQRVHIHIPSPGPESLWVRACNSAGCSGFRQGDKNATYSQYCL